MKTNIISKLAIITACMLTMGWGYSQTTPNNSTSKNQVRIQMVKNINGVETLVDTTLSLEGLEDFNASSMPNMDIDIHLDSIMKDVEIQMVDLEKQLNLVELEMSNLKELKNLEKLDLKILQDLPQLEIYMDSMLGKMDKHILFKTIDIQQGISETDSNITIMVLDENDAEFQKMMAELGKGDSNTIHSEHRIIIINEDANEANPEGKQTQIKMEIVVKTCNILELDKADKKSLNPEVRAGFSDNLKIDQVDFYPNPNNGQFNLSFNLSNQGDTEISVFTMDGKKVYEEKLPNFTGNYKQEIDISKNAPGIYFIRVNQGKKAWFKKMILE
jgi:hypothetical protein